MSGKRRSPRLAEKKKANLLDARTYTPEVLLNDLVLQNIFKYLGYKDLKSVRNVKNSIWLRNSNKAWWARTKVTFRRGSADMTSIFKNYLNQPEINSCVRNYELSEFSTVQYQRNWKSFRINNRNGFWRRFGHSIKYLNLYSCNYTFRSVDEFRQLFYTKCPNLEELVLKYLHIKTWPAAVEPMTWQEPQFQVQTNLKFLRLYVQGYMPFSWMELLSHFPNLEALETNTKVDIWKVISIIRQHNPKMLKLKHIDIRYRHETDCEDSPRLVLLDPNLSFETIRIVYKACQPETLWNILDLHAKTLKELSLRGEFVETPIQIQISPRQPLYNLEKLNLLGCLFTADIFRFTPNLRKVNINCCLTLPNVLTSDNSNLRIDTCKEINLGSQYILYEGRSPNLNLPFFFNVFPNVEILKMSVLYNSEFSMICERWTKLVSINIFTSLVDDFGLLGFDPVSTIETVRKPNITNLKELKSFSMTKCPDRSGNTRVEIKNGDVVLKELEKLPNLKTFRLNSYGDIEWSFLMKISEKYPRNYEA